MLTFDEYRALDGLGLAELIKKGDVSRDEVATVAHAAFTEAHEKLNCAVEIAPLEDCKKRAAEAPDALFGGVPFAFKDLGAHPAYGLQESGSRFCQGLPNGHASHLATRFEAAGVVGMGRTTVPEFGYNTATETIAYGQTKNPWNIAHTPGGSSGGSSAAVAYGALPVAHANDGGGSIRIPAAYCGLVGLKPGRGRVSTGPDFAEGLNGLGIEHIVSRTVRDTAAMLDYASEPAVGEPYLVAPPANSYLSAVSRDPVPLRIGIITTPWENGWPTDPELVASVEATGRLCADLGHHVEPASLAIEADMFTVATARIWSSTLALWTQAITAATGRKVDESTMEPAMLACHAYGSALTAAELQEAFVVFNAIGRTVGQLFAKYDLLLTPTTAVSAPLLGEMSADRHDLDAIGWTAHLFGPAPFTATFNASGNPAISLPLGRTKSGLPIGSHFVSQHNGEETLLSLAGALERAAPWQRCADRL